MQSSITTLVVQSVEQNTPIVRLPQSISAFVARQRTPLMTLGYFLTHVARRAIGVSNLNVDTSACCCVIQVE